MAQKRKLPPTVETLESLAVTALANGGQFLATTRNVHWDISGVCRKPVGVTLNSKHARRINRPRTMMTVTMQTKCRKCPECLRERGLIWTGRAVAEMEQAKRTWFGTLTFRPEIHYQMELRARAHGANLHGLTPAEKFPWLAQQAGIELTKYIKRLRERVAGPLRYLAVCEYHDSKKTSEALRYRPHLHLLVHETSDAVIKWNDLAASWSLGHVKWKLVTPGDTRPAWYVAKYLTKSTFTRIRASQDYGKTTLSEHSAS